MRIHLPHLPHLPQIPASVADLYLLAGGALIAAGIFWIYPPAGVITLGLALVGAGILRAYGAPRERPTR